MRNRTKLMGLPAIGLGVSLGYLAASGQLPMAAPLLCSPTRAALLTGRNHHVCNMGSITETATGFPGQTGQRPDSVAPLADRWPTRSGFDKCYGFIGGEANQWAPGLYEGLNKIETPRGPKYHLMTDLADQAIRWTGSQKSLTPDKPFFTYFAPGATHAPHHVPEEWIAKYKGKFDQGWGKLREETLARQVALGVVPAGTRLAPKPEAIKDWAKLSADEKRLLARQMEVFAGFGEYADFDVVPAFVDGRLLFGECPHRGDLGELCRDAARLFRARRSEPGWRGEPARITRVDAGHSEPEQSLRGVALSVQTTKDDGISGGPRRLLSMCSGGRPAPRTWDGGAASSATPSPRR